MGPTSCIATTQKATWQFFTTTQMHLRKKVQLLAFAMGMWVDVPFTLKNSAFFL
jgi:hypothetical protein